MAQLTFKFVGACIHMTQLRPYRVVLPSGIVASGPQSYTYAPKLSIQGMAPLPLDRATVSIGAFDGAEPKISLPCVPHIPNITSNPLLTNVVLNQQSPAGAYLDFMNCTVEGWTYDGPSAYATITAEVPDAAFQIFSWDTAKEVITVRIENPEVPIIIDNLPLPRAVFNDPLEYSANLLVTRDFGVTQSVLDSIHVALKDMVECLDQRRVTPDVFPSCSNSQWP